MPTAAVLVELIGGPKAVVEIDLELLAVKVASQTAEALGRSIQSDDGSEKPWKIYAPNRSGGFAPLPASATLEAAARAIKKKVDAGKETGFGGPGEHEGKSYSFRIRLFVPTAPPPIQEPETPTVSDDEIIDLTNMEGDSSLESVRRNPKRTRARKRRKTGDGRADAGNSGSGRKTRKRGRDPTATGEIKRKRRRRKSVADASVADGSLADESVADDSVADESVADESVADESVAEDVGADGSVADESVADGSVAEDAGADGSVADESVADESVAEDVGADGSVADESGADESVAEDAGADGSGAEDARADEPTAGEPAPDDSQSDEDEAESAHTLRQETAAEGGEARPTASEERQPAAPEEAQPAAPEEAQPAAPAEAQAAAPEEAQAIPSEGEHAAASEPEHAPEAEAAPPDQRAEDDVQEHVPTERAAAVEDDESVATLEDEAIEDLEAGGLAAPGSGEAPERVDTTRRVVTTTPPDVKAPERGDVAVTKPFAAQLSQDSMSLMPRARSTGGGREARKRKAKRNNLLLGVGLLVSLTVFAGLAFSLMQLLKGTPAPPGPTTEAAAPAARPAPARVADSVQIAAFAGAARSADDPVALAVQRFNGLGAESPADLATSAHLAALASLHGGLTDLCQNQHRWDACLARSRVVLAGHRACEAAQCPADSAVAPLSDAVASARQARSQLRTIADQEGQRAALNRLAVHAVRLAGTDWVSLQAEAPKLADLARRVCSKPRYRAQPDCSEAGKGSPAAEPN